MRAFVIAKIVHFVVKLLHETYLSAFERYLNVISLQPSYLCIVNERQAFISIKTEQLKQLS